MTGYVVIQFIATLPLAVWHSGNTLSPSAKLCYARPSVTVLGQVNHPLCAEPATQPGLLSVGRHSEYRHWPVTVISLAVLAGVVSA